MVRRLSGEARDAAARGHRALIAEARRSVAEAPPGDGARLAFEVAASAVALSLSALGAYEEAIAPGGSPPSLAPAFCSVLWRWETRPEAERERRAREAAALLASPGGDG